MRTGRNQKKVIALLWTLTHFKHTWLSARDIADTSNMNHESTLAWLYSLHEEGLVECRNENPRKWRWK